MDGSGGRVAGSALVVVVRRIAGCVAGDFEKSVAVVDLAGDWVLGIGTGGGTPKVE